MPTADYYMKMRFQTKEAAAHALPEFRAFLDEGVRAHAWWQSHRLLENKGQRAEFWKQFRSLFPDVTDCLADKVDGDCDQALLGFLEFGREGTVELECSSVFLKYKAEVWHSAEWDPLGEFVKRKFGALGFAWIGDEPCIDLFDILKP